jgi:hypothetical protein
MRLVSQGCKNDASVTTAAIRGETTHYPSTPASNARLLSSNDDIPVNAKILVGLKSVVICARSASIFLICSVAPTPVRFGIDISNKTTLHGLVRMMNTLLDATTYSKGPSF